MLLAVLVGVRPSISLLHTLLDLSVDLHFLFFGKVLFEMVTLLNFFFFLLVRLASPECHNRANLCCEAIFSQKDCCWNAWTQAGYLCFLLSHLPQKDNPVTGLPLVSLLPSLH